MILPYPAGATGEIAPPLRNGDRMNSDEFRRRLESSPNQKGELLDGVVHMAAATRATLHGRPHSRLSHWLSEYELETPGAEAYVETTVRFDDAQCPQPDLFLLIEPACGGQALLSTDDYVEGAPELVAEISASTQGEDLHDKFNLYHQNGVREYIVWRTPEKRIEWYVARKRGFKALAASSDGILKSETFPGLWLDAEAMAAAKVKRVLKVLRQGFASPEHAAFVAKLKAARK